MRYHFADCVLDTESYSLEKAGKPVSVEPQVFDLIKLLVENAGALVTKDQLIYTVWSGRIVSEAAISARISAARTAVGDTGKAQSVIKTIPRRGIELIADVSSEDLKPWTRQNSLLKQTIRFTSSNDGTQLAFAVSGEGAKVMRAGHFLTHLEMDWSSPVWKPYLEALSADHSLVRFDQRGTGLSDPQLRDTGLNAYTEDLLAVADAAGLDRFPLIASSQGVPVAINVAANHPDRISHLVLFGGFAQGRAKRDHDYADDEAKALLSLIRSGWGNPKSAFMIAFTSVFCPEASKEELDNLVEIQLASCSPENAARIREAIDQFDVLDRLQAVTAPTLVIHASNDALHPVSQGRLIAGAIPGAEFLQVDSRNHVYLPSDPVWRQIVDAQLNFIST
ncbi:alpha/beta fold hydrolase [Roseibium sp.]|uniref:alpha/beta fold hydrolase n=1 Tax=Roseibium sp. TaxID=1936156 RepID=UPI003B5177C3